MSKYKDFVEGILHGYDFNVLQGLQTAIEFKRKVPPYFLETNGYYHELGIGPTKDEARQARQELIEEIVDAILHQTETKHGNQMLPDNYARLFHALAILKLEKKSLLLPSDGNPMSRCAYNLWQLDDGSTRNGSLIITTCWYLAESIKKGYSLS